MDDFATEEESSSSSLSLYLGELENSFQPVNLTGIGRGILFLTSRILCFLTPSSSSISKDAAHTETGEREEETEEKKKEGDETGEVYDLRFLLWLHHWTSTERSKKTAKARLTYSNPPTEPSLPGVCTAVLDFGTDRSMMDSACSLLQQLHGNLLRSSSSSSSQLSHPASLPRLHLLSTLREAESGQGDTILSDFLNSLKTALQLPLSSSIHFSSSLPSSHHLLLPATSSFLSSLNEGRSPSFLLSDATPEKDRQPGLAASQQVDSSPRASLTPSLRPPAQGIAGHSSIGSSQDDRSVRQGRPNSSSSSSAGLSEIRDASSAPGGGQGDLGGKEKGPLSSFSASQIQSVSSSLQDARKRSRETTGGEEQRLPSDKKSTAVMMNILSESSRAGSFPPSSQQGKVMRSHETSSSHRGRETSGVLTPRESLDSRKKDGASPPRLVSPPRVSLRDLERKEKQRERRELRELRRSLLNTNLSLRNLYTFLVRDPAEESEGDDGDLDEEDGGGEGEESASTRNNSAQGALNRQDSKRESERNLKAKSSAAGGRRGKVLTPDEFWKLHETELLAHRMQPTPEAPASSFLLRPPQFEVVGGTAGSSDQTSLLVNCNGQMLEAILDEDPRIRRVYGQLVLTGQMTREKFFERLFQSNYFQEFLGLLPPAMRSGSNSASHTSSNSDDSGSLINLPHTSIPPLLTPRPQEVLNLVSPSEDLISTEASRVTGFGIADGFNSFSGDLSSYPSKHLVGSSPSSIAASLSSGAPLPASRGPLRSRLLERFNRQSLRLLLQQMLPPSAADVVSSSVASKRSQAREDSTNRPPSAVTTSEETSMIIEQLHLMAEKEKEIARTEFDRKHKDALKVRQIEKVDAPLSSFKELKLREDLRLNDLEAVEPLHLPQLEVGRRQLYAAGSRGLLNNKQQSSPSSSTAVSSPEQEMSRELSERRNEEDIVETWVKECASQVEGGNKTITPDSSIYETGRYMFVFNTKLCQSEKAAQVAALEYDPLTVNAVRTQQLRVTELLQHFYTSTLPDEAKRTRIIQALEATKYELERTQESTFGPYTGAATKALCMPLFDQINAAKTHHNKLRKLLADLRAQRKSHHMRQFAAAAGAPPNVSKPVANA
ncbi:hypothetical protein CSUI_006947 [Cystoisospora suis]|uniref:BSD domain-containing protein n=1 Tax=Cystoisospora suis TaxID=483139 RepID=A0A2C6KSB1_9APIC|nr:hypothetical protein CSUI_006947 [Cystoisospora suis]